MGHDSIIESRSRKTREWSRVSILLLVAVIAEMVWFSATWKTMLRTWVTIDTYNYGLVVPFISVYLLYRERERLTSDSPSPSYWGVVATAGASLVWAVGSLAGLLLLQHIAVLAMIPAAALAFLGPHIMRNAAFPFLYVLLAVPAGEFLIPGLITWTADFSVMSLESIGIPVFRDGPYIRIPAGDFHVVKACSGIRYLLTSVVLGVLFAHLGFISWKRKAAFVALCIVAPIVANWIRATGIILFGHLSDMKMAAGVDHLIYGWIFFGVVMLIIYLIGNTFRDGHIGTVTTAGNGAESGATPSTGISTTVFVFIFVIVAAPSGSFATRLLSADIDQTTVDGQRAVGLPIASTGWIRRNEISRSWNPVFVGAESVSKVEYETQSLNVSMIVVAYGKQTQDAELISARNSLYELGTWWTRFDRKHRYRNAAQGRDLHFREISLNDGSRDRLIWSWYSISGSEISNEFNAKLVMLRTLLAGDPGNSYLVALAVDYDEDIELARESLGRFLEDHLHTLTLCLSASISIGGKCD